MGVSLNGRIGVGIIGASVDRGTGTAAYPPWAKIAHVPAIRALDRFELTAVATTKQATADSARESYGARRGYADAGELIDDPDVDLVVVCVRVPYHDDLVDLAIKAGKHVYCEWPLSLTTRAADDLSLAADRRGVVNVVGLQARSAPALRHVRDLVANGAVGTVLAVNVTVNVPTWGPEIDAPVAYLADAFNNATLLSVYGGHSLDAVSFCLGEIDEISAQIDRRYATTRVVETGEVIDKTSPDQVLLHGRFEGGASLSCHLQGGVRGSRGTEIRITGTEGDLLVRSAYTIQASPLELFGARHPSRDGSAVELAPVAELEPVPLPGDLRSAPAVLGDGPAANVAEQYVQIAAAIESGSSCSADFALAARRHRLLDVIEHAAATGTRQRI